MQNGDLNITALQSTGVSLVRLDRSTTWTQSGNVVLNLLDQLSSGFGALTGLLTLCCVRPLLMTDASLCRLDQA
jgi:hypothetical protein